MFKRRPRTTPSLSGGRSLIGIAVIATAALACTLTFGNRSAASSEAVDLSSAAALYDEVGVSLEQALSAESEDRRPKLLELMGPPDAFTLEWQELNGRSIRWEEWSYFDFESRFDFVDGDLLWTLDIPPVADGSIYAHVFDPLAFQAGMSTAEVKAMFPVLPFVEIPLQEADIPAGLLLATDQLLLGFNDDQLVFVQTFVLSPDEALSYD